MSSIKGLLGWLASHPDRRLTKNIVESKGEQLTLNNDLA